MENEKDFMFDEKTYSFLSKRLKSIDEESNFAMLAIIELLATRSDFCFTREIKDMLDRQYIFVAPLIKSLYSSGFIDKRNVGTKIMYKLNINGRKLLEDLRR